MSKMSKACDINPKTKERVWDRDAHRCIICGSRYAMPNAHYIRRSQGGLGIRENIVTLCQDCHNAFDNGDKREEYGKLIKEYLDGWYPDFPDEKRVYDKWDWLYKDWEEEDD